MLTSILIPARNEARNILQTVNAIVNEFEKGKKDYEILIINDASTDNTAEIIKNTSNPKIRIIDNLGKNGIGNAIKIGLENFKGDCVIIAMADASDEPKDMLEYTKNIENGYDCCFGNRWNKGSKVVKYPAHKLILNRLINHIIRLLFGLKYTDITNAFKCYSKETIEGIKPILSHHFNITVELPLKSIIRGYSYNVINTNWYCRTNGVSSLKIKEMGSRYLFIIIYVLLEKYLSKGDYVKHTI